MLQKKNIGFEFEKIAASDPDFPAIVAADITVSYGKLWRIAESFAVRMRENGIGRTSIVAVSTTDMIVSAATMLATCLVGAQYVVPDRKMVEAGVINPTHFLRSPETQGIDGVNYTLMDQYWAPAFADKVVPEPFEGFASIDDPWWILSTSGTTGDAKYLYLSQRLAFDRSVAVKGDFITGETRVCILFLCSARPFFVRAMASFMNKCTIIDSFDPTFWHKNGVNFVCASPHLMVDWLGKNDLETKMDRLQVSGAKLNDPDAKLLLENFHQVEDVYGSSETNKSYVNLKSLNGLGEVQTVGVKKDSEIEIVSEDGTKIENGTSGVVRIRNAYMVAGYINNPSASKKAFRGGWFYPGDIGRFTKDKALEIIGRTDAVINLDGVKIDPSRIDTVFKSVEGVSHAACFLDPDESSGPRLMAFLVLENTEESDTIVRNAQSTCVAKFGARITPQTILVVPDFPLTNDGVPKRAECRTLARSLVGSAQWRQ